MQTILIIDDELFIRQSLSVILRNAGYSVTAAADPFEAMQCLKAGSYDLILLDLKLPGMDGLDLLEHIRYLNVDTPVLIVTANANTDSAIAALRHRAVDYIKKPIDPKDIVQRINKILEEEKLVRQQRDLQDRLQELVYELGVINGKNHSENGHSNGFSIKNGSRHAYAGNVKVDLHAQIAYIKDKPLNLAPSTFSYLASLVRRSPDPVSYEDLASECQGYKMTRIEASEIARWQIHKLRKAIEPDPRHPRYILTIRNFGYQLVDPEFDPGDE